MKNIAILNKFNQRSFLSIEQNTTFRRLYIQVSITNLFILHD